MSPKDQRILPLEAAALAGKAVELKAGGHRLVQVCATTLAEEFEVTYSFDKDGDLASYRVRVPRSAGSIPSITGSYFAAFTYENELQDLFGLKVEGLALDFKGTFYHLARKAPFAETKASQGGR